MSCNLSQNLVGYISINVTIIISMTRKIRKPKKADRKKQLPFYAFQAIVAASLIYVLFPWSPSIEAANNPVVQITTKNPTKEDQCNLDNTVKALNTSLPKNSKLNPCATVPVKEVLQKVPNAVELGRQMAAARGWTGANWNALYLIWMRESGWNPRSVNRSSGACGIPQAYPCSKIPDKSTAGQIKWGLDYIARRYGSPSAAWAHWQRNHSY